MENIQQRYFISHYSSIYLTKRFDDISAHSLLPFLGSWLFGDRGAWVGLHQREAHWTSLQSLSQRASRVPGQWGRPELWIYDRALHCRGSWLASQSSEEYNQIVESLILTTVLKSCWPLTKTDTFPPSVSENKVLCHPSSIDSLSTSAATEDHVSMGGWAARKALRVVEHVEQGPKSDINLPYTHWHHPLINLAKIVTIIAPSTGAPKHNSTNSNNI